MIFSAFLIVLFTADTCLSTPQDFYPWNRPIPSSIVPAPVAININTPAHDTTPTLALAPAPIPASAPVFAAAAQAAAVTPQRCQSGCIEMFLPDLQEDYDDEKYRCVKSAFKYANKRLLARYTKGWC